MLQLVTNHEKPDFSVFYQDNFDKAVWYIENKIGNHHDAQDLASDIFTYCYGHYDEYDPAKSSITTWLYVVINSRVKNYYRDHKQHADIDDFAPILADENTDMENSVYLEQLHDTLMRAIRTLPEKQQTAVMMRYFEEASSQDIADALGTTTGNVRVILTRALDTLEKKCGNLLKGVL